MCGINDEKDFLGLCIKTKNNSGPSIGTTEIKPLADRSIITKVSETKRKSLMKRNSSIKGLIEAGPLTIWKILDILCCGGETRDICIYSPVSELSKYESSKEDVLYTINFKKLGKALVCGDAITDEIEFDNEMSDLFDIYFNFVF